MLGTREVCQMPSWSSTLHQRLMLQSRLALLSDGKIKITNPSFLFLYIGCTACVHHIIIISVFACACGKKEKKRQVGLKHCGQIKDIWHSSIQSDSDVDMKQCWINRKDDTHAHTRTHSVYFAWSPTYSSGAGNHGHHLVETRVDILTAGATNQITDRPITR